MFKYWDVKDNCLKHDKLFNFIIGMRGVGKTFSLAKLCANDFINSGYKNQFIYVRRFKSEFESVSSFFNDLIDNNKFPNNKLEVKGKKFYIDEKYCGRAIELTRAITQKSVPYPEVTTIIFDEFILNTEGHYRYLKNEVHAFFELYSTIARTRRVKVYFLSNAISEINPYFNFLDINMPYNKDYYVYKDKSIYIERTKNEALKKKIYESEFGKIIKNTAYGNYAVENNFLLDDTTFIEKKTGNCDYICTINHKGYKYGAWVNYQTGLIYLSNDVINNYRFEFATTTDSHAPNLMFIKSARKSVIFKKIIEAYEYGYIRFENKKIKSAIMDVLRKVI